MFEKTIGQELIAHKVIEVVLEREIKEGLESLSDEINMLHNYYNFMIEERRLDQRATNHSKILISFDNVNKEQEIDV
jgi:hypothetical protein